MGAMVEAARGTALQVRGVRDIGPDYAVTLRAWRSAWEEKKEAVLQLGYSERFWRKYRCASKEPGRFTAYFNHVSCYLRRPNAC